MTPFDARLRSASLVAPLLYTPHTKPYLAIVTHALAAQRSGVTGLVTRIGQATIDAARAVSDISTWGPLLIVQMRRLGVDSIPIALFIAVFTGIVLALLSSYIFTGAVPRSFVGALVGKTIMMELGPVLTGLALAGRVGANIAAEVGISDAAAVERYTGESTPIFQVFGILTAYGVSPMAM
jgi:ABC-type transporter Mla maintaining outer membrane lipid asymmetry permease subunit MlaE